MLTSWAFRWQVQSVPFPYRDPLLVHRHTQTQLHSQPAARWKHIRFSKNFQDPNLWLFPLCSEGLSFDVEAKFVCPQTAL